MQLSPVRVQRVHLTTQSVPARPSRQLGIRPENQFKRVIRLQGRRASPHFENLLRNTSCNHLTGLRATVPANTRAHRTSFFRQFSTSGAAISCAPCEPAAVYLQSVRRACANSQTLLTAARVLQQRSRLHAVGVERVCTNQALSANGAAMRALDLHRTRLKSARNQQYLQRTAVHELPKSALVVKMQSQLQARTDHEASFLSAHAAVGYARRSQRFQESTMTDVRERQAARARRAVTPLRAPVSHPNQPIVVSERVYVRRSVR